MDIQQRRVTHSDEGRPVFLYTLVNDHGLQAEISNYGGILISLRVPGRDGTAVDVIVGAELEDLMQVNRGHFGSLVGRYANRIAGAAFTLDGVEYRLAANEGRNHIHGGVKGFGRVVWDPQPRQQADRVELNLHYLSPDGEEGYPGNLWVRVTYALSNDNELIIAYQAHTDRKTVLNLTNHSYFNLAGHESRASLDHEVRIDANFYTPVDDELIPTGEILRVGGTPLDLREGKRLGDALTDLPGGFDHNFVLKPRTDGQPAPAVRLSHPAGGRVMEILTTQPGVQFYSGNFMDGTVKGKGSALYHKHQGLAFETQHFPDSPHYPHFPSTVLEPGQTYRQVTVHRFSIL